MKVLFHLNVGWPMRNQQSVSVVWHDRACTCTACEEQKVRANARRRDRRPTYPRPSSSDKAFGPCAQTSRPPRTFSPAYTVPRAPCTAPPRPCCCPSSFVVARRARRVTRIHVRPQWRGTIVNKSRDVLLSASTLHHNNSVTSRASSRQLSGRMQTTRNTGERTPLIH